MERLTSQGNPKFATTLNASVQSHEFWALQRTTNWRFSPILVQPGFETTDLRMRQQLKTANFILFALA
ncbi:hypothetical protein H6F51_10340 [Cyanobacteria bacterium FACHB-DQ100]|nr:hypothetical protein [Cyanobacteria bacterium FACHB-DQ100]